MPIERPDAPSSPAGPVRPGEEENAEIHAPPPTPTARRAAVEETAGALTGVYSPDELASLREDWPD